VDVYDFMIFYSIRHPLFAGFRKALPSLQSATINSLYFQFPRYCPDIPTGITMGSSYASGYGYDPRGRMNAVSWSVNGISHNIQYTRIDNSDQIYQITSDTGHKVTYEYEDHRDLKTRGIRGTPYLIF
jgi:hypothetical protein